MHKRALGFGVCLMLFAWSTDSRLSAVVLVGVGYSMMIKMASTSALVPGDGPRRFPRSRHGGLLDDVHGYGASGGAAGRVDRPEYRRNDGGAVCIVGALLFRRGLPVLREEARGLVRAQTAAYAADNNGMPPGR